MLDTLRCDDFEPLIGKTLAVEAGGEHGELEVKEARLLPSPSPRATPPFQITLRSRDNWRLPQGMFRVAHPTLGELPLFAVPVGPDDIGPCYEIIFN